MEERWNADELAWLATVALMPVAEAVLVMRMPQTVASVWAQVVAFEDLKTVALLRDEVVFILESGGRPGWREFHGPARGNG